MATLEFGVDTFGDIPVDLDGKRVSDAQAIRQVVAEGELAEHVGIDVFGVGEHHRDDFAVAAPELVLAALAARTERIRLASAVTVLSSDDPVRIYERFATLDALSHGRAEIIAGRGSFTESFPLFGYSLADYELLFEEKLDLLVRLLDEGPVTWSGTTRAPLMEQQVYPKTESGRITTWVGVGGSPDSVVRAARHGLPLVLAIIGGAPARFRPYVDLFHRALGQLGREPLPVAAHSPGFVAASDDEAAELYWAHYRRMIDRIGRERGWPPTTRASFDADIMEGSLYVGSPETVAKKVARTVRALGIQRFTLKYSAGTLPHEKMMTSIELFGRDVIPRVRELLAADALALS